MSQLFFPFKRFIHWSLCTFLVLGLIGCTTSRPQPKPPAEVLAANAVKKMKDNLKQTAKRLRRKRISTSRNRYEGSLWRYESSFGNLLRDHRARFRGDLLRINEVNLIVNVPSPKIASETAGVALEALTLRDAIEEEQNDILRALDALSARVIRVLPDGNMLIKVKKLIIASAIKSATLQLLLEFYALQT